VDSKRAILRRKVIRPKELFLFNQKLHAFLRLLTLVYVGFPEDVVFEPVRYQSKKWH